MRYTIVDIDVKSNYIYVYIMYYTLWYRYFPIKNNKTKKQEYDDDDDN